ncbi:rhamnogalacturonan acetylesterase [Geobacillus sp. TFV-3]|uniref:rhamnogalacturonan acetylesterase n=1 Tax=Geobacillus sp. TFV-3 TaxID=1897059 RepID=UPI001358F6D7|nr:rhamnogalacturonan acetylesterase [Geobacillus sp. TFV-3]KAF0995309.1 Rhamnogalacturonan acetylesterase RhgT [Geobacillus sp. TFV-3]
MKRTKAAFVWGIIITVAAVLLTRTATDGKASKAGKETVITIYLAGDSTVAAVPRSRTPRTGWGEMLGAWFDDKVVVKNMAASGRSAKSFVEEGRLSRILHEMKQGDYLFIQFGHNDEKVNDPARCTEPFTSYQAYLKQYIDGARVKGATPVLITPVERRRFSADGQALNSHGLYPAAMKALGEREHVPVIDLTTKSRQRFEQLGPEQTKQLFLWLAPGEHPNYPHGIKDNTHFHERGAKEIARLIVEGIIELNLPLRRHLTRFLD